MCGIVGYTGARNALPILMNGLKKLEYRGYDSAGVAFFTEDGIDLVKTKGRLSVLEEKLAPVMDVPSHCGIGHTRWATHGEPTDINSHPQSNARGTIAVVHNGIIENYMELKARLIRHGYQFVSETDTEVIAHLLDFFYVDDMIDAMLKVITTVKGSYALGVIMEDRPYEIITARHDSPLVIGLGEGENFIASDIPAILEHTRNFLLIDDAEVARITPDSVTIYDVDYHEIKKEPFHVNWSVEAAEKGGFPHFMLKEIFEQPHAVCDTVSPRIKDGKIDLSELSMSDEALAAIERIHIVACGSAAHVGVVIKYLLEQNARIPVEWDLASEFRYRSPILGEHDLAIIISQSGETADTLAALREAKRHGVQTLAVVNMVGSTIAREADHVLYTWAGPEIAVATTKAYSTQLALLTLFALKLAAVRGTLSEAECSRLAQCALTLPEKIEQVLENKNDLQYFAARFCNLRDIFFIGRGLDYAVAMEGSLKLKEVSYIRSEAYAAGELKHGTIALVQNDTLLIALATQEELIEKMISNIREVKARGGRVLTLAFARDAEKVRGVSDYLFLLPDMEELFAPSLSVIALQLLAYYISVERGCDVDKPRNLAKSVTVE